MDAAAVSLGVSAVSAATAISAAFIAVRAQRRGQQAKLTVESAAEDGDGWAVDISNLGFHSARHVVVEILDAQGCVVASSGDIKFGGPVLHAHERKTLTARPRKRSSDAPRPRYPLKVRAAWKHWEREKEFEHYSSLLISSPDQADPRADP